MSQNKTKYKLFNECTIKELKEEGKYLYSADFTVPIKRDDGSITIAQFDSVNETTKFKLENKVYDLVQFGGSILPTETVIQNNEILEKSSLGELVKKHIDLFFNNLAIYDELGITKKTRGMLLHSKAGAGKSTVICRAANEYSKTKNACVLIWPSSKIEADDLKFFLSKQCDWNNIDKLILILEDIGGGNLDDGEHHRGVDAGLLNFLDGVDNFYVKPTFIVATTNNPDSHLASLTSRPGRFDLVIKVPELTDNEKVEFYKFFSKSHWMQNLEETDYGQDIIKYSKKFQICHVKEAVIRARLEMTIDETKSSFTIHLLKAAKDISDWIERQEQGTLAKGEQKRRLGFEDLD